MGAKGGDAKRSATDDGLVQDNSLIVMKGMFNTLHFIFNHPLTRNHKVSALKRYLSWQVMSRAHSSALVYPFVEESRMIVENGMTGATGNIYTGLHEFGEMGFLLHLLRPGDLFGDIGANVGSYTILASAVIKSDTIGVEPVASTFMHLKHNVSLNNIEPRVSLFHNGVGSERGKLNFTNSHDTVNHVITPDESLKEEFEEVDILTLDEIFSGRIPTLLKIDVEGYEMSVLEGANYTLSREELKAIIIELNGLCRRYGVKEEDIHKRLLSCGFNAVEYDPIRRKIEPKSTFNEVGNTIYVRETEWIMERVVCARKISVLNQEI
jgi:FkbM family methyltransferase